MLPRPARAWVLSARAHRAWSGPWLGFALVTGVYMLTQFHRIAPAAISHELILGFHLNQAGMGLVAGMYFYMYTLMQLPTGLLVDVWGPKRVLTMGALLAGVGSLSFAQAHGLEGALFGRCLIGLGVSVTFVAFLKLLTLWFAPRHFASLTGLVVMLGNIGALVSTAPLAWLSQQTSWRYVFTALGMISALLALLMLRYLRVESAGHVAAAPVPVRMGAACRSVLGRWTTWPPFMVCTLVAGTFLTFAGLWAVPYWEQVHHYSHALATQLQAGMIACFALSSLVTGWVSDRWSRRQPVLLVLALVYAGAWVALASQQFLSVGAAWVLMLLLGASVPAFTLTWPLAKEANRPEYAGTATSLVNGGAFLATGILQWALGWWLDGHPLQRAQAYGQGLWFLALLAVLGLVWGWWCRDQVPLGSELRVGV